MSWFSPQNPGIDGIDELTNAEETFVTSLAGLSYTQGDILYYDGSNLTNLAKGTDGQVLQLSSGIPIWINYDHGTLSGLADDDHTQYILADGTRAFTGNQSFGDNNITNVGDISLDTVSDDAGIENTLSIANLNTAYDHSQDNTQAHSDYLLNTGDTGTGDYILDGAVTINEAGADKDFRVEGLTETHLLFVDAGLDIVMFGTNTQPDPNAFFTVSATNPSIWMEDTGNNALWYFGVAGGAFQIVDRYQGVNQRLFYGYGDLIGGGTGVFAINNGNNNIDLTYSGDTTSNIWKIDASTEKILTLDNIPYAMGTGGDSEIYYNGTNMILDPNVVGTGKVLIGATGNDTINAGAYEVGGAAGLSGTYTFGGGASGDVASMTFTSGLLTAITTVP